MINRAFILSAFPGTGKSFIAKNNDTISDSDSSIFPKSDFPQNYIEHILNARKTKDMVLVSSHDNVRAALLENKIEFTLAYPDVSLKSEYMERYKERGSPKPFLDLMENNFEKFVESCAAQTGCKHIVLQSGQYLADVL